MKHAMPSNVCLRWLVAGALTVSAAGALAFDPPDRSDSSLDGREFFIPELYMSSSNVPLDEALAQLPNRTAWKRFQQQRKAGDVAPVVYIDPRSGVASNIMAPFPLIPGDGHRNQVTLKSLGDRLGREVREVDEKTVGDAALAFIREHAGILGINPAQLGALTVGKVSDELWQVKAARQVGGVEVRYAQVLVTISHGNVVMFGADLWGNVKLDTQPAVEGARALELGFNYIGGRSVSDELKADPRLEIVPVAPQQFQQGEAFAGPIGKGYGHRLVWTYRFQRQPEAAEWELKIDAHSGDVIAMEDKNQYVDRTIKGGVYPLTNTGICPTPQTCGTMQADTALPFMNTGFAAPNNFTSSGGAYDYTSGTATTTLAGKHFTMSDTCGAVSASNATGTIDLGGTNNQHDCTTPGSGGAGNTPAMRAGAYELNRIHELARSWLPGNTWLTTSVVPANMNINLTCNAFYSSGAGSVNFYRTGGGCRNSGEIAAVFDHEWGHGLDDNDALGSLSNSSEGYADIASIYRLQASCVGHGFFDNSVAGSCGTTADGTSRNVDEDQTAGVHCALDCAGVRDSDWDKHADHTPDTALNHVCPRCLSGGAPCGRQVHCAAAPVRQAAWDYVARDLQAAPFNYTVQQAFMIGNRTFYRGSGAITNWYACTCTTSSDGCNASAGYPQWIAGDDDNGNVNDGTPHMTAIHAAFNRHGIACGTPTPANSGCAAGPTQKPAVGIAPGPASGQVTVNWDGIPGVTKYWVFRSDGFAGCLFGKAIIATVTTASGAAGTFTDTKLAQGRRFYYNVVAVNASSDACVSPTSRCVSELPLP